jgi:hypothetical protein
VSGLKQQVGIMAEEKLKHLLSKCSAEQLLDNLRNLGKPGTDQVQVNDCRALQSLMDRIAEVRVFKARGFHHLSKVYDYIPLENADHTVTNVMTSFNVPLCCAKVADHPHKGTSEQQITLLEHLIALIPPILP